MESERVRESSEPARGHRVADSACRDIGDINATLREAAFTRLLSQLLSALCGLVVLLFLFW